jgi:hypothetical protein
MPVSKDERIVFLTELRKEAADRLYARLDCPFRLEVLVRIDRDLQNALRAQQQEREADHPKPHQPAARRGRRWP